MQFLEELKNNLGYLKLPYLQNNIDKISKDAAEKKLSHLEFFASAISMEIEGKHERAIQRRIKEASFPFIKTLEEFKWSHPTKINRDFVKHLFSLNFIQEKRNIAFVGVPGTGKSHLAIALGHHACINGYKVIFEPVYSMIEELSIAKEKGTFIKTMKKYTSAQLLIIDEIGFVPINQDDSNLFFQVISRRYEKGGIVITTNRAFKEWATIFNGDQIITSGMLDRLLHRCDPVHIEGLSYRMREIQN